MASWNGDFCPEPPADGLKPSNFAVRASISLMPSIQPCKFSAARAVL